MKTTILIALLLTITAIGAPFDAAENKRLDRSGAPVFHSGERATGERGTFLVTVGSEFLSGKKEEYLHRALNQDVKLRREILAAMKRVEQADKAK